MMLLRAAHDGRPFIAGFARILSRATSGSWGDAIKKDHPRGVQAAYPEFRESSGIADIFREFLTTTR